MHRNVPMDSNLATEPRGGAGQEPMMPLGMGDFESEAANDPLAGAEEGQKLNTGTILIVVVIIVAAVGLFSMRKLSQMSAASGDDGGILESLKKIRDFERANPTGDGSAISILTTSNFQFVPWGNVKSDPFTPLDGPRPTGPAAVAAGVDPKVAMETLFAEGAEQLKLSMVVLASPSMANLNHKIVRVGSRVQVQVDGTTVEFEVTTIETDAVTVVAEDRTLGVRLERRVLLNRDF